MIDETHDTARTSWLESAKGHPTFPIQNLPIGIFSVGGDDPRIGVAIGEKIIDLKAASVFLPSEWADALSQASLNDWFERGPDDARSLRRHLSDMLSDASWRGRLEPLLHDGIAATMHLPASVGDYTDFYVGIYHATNVGKQFRPDNPLLPNYKYIPIGYHGRASSVQASGAPLVRPKGQRKPPEAEIPDYGPSRRLDYELEMGIWIGRGNKLGTPIPIGEASRHIAGYCLLNDWSARDLQAWEYQPLGPFLAKNFLTTVSPWVVTPDALAPFMRPTFDRPAGDPAPLPYLENSDDRARGALGVQLRTVLVTQKMREAGQPPCVLSEGDAASAMYWSAAQIVTHHASNGCNLQPGDLIGTGTLSTALESGLGSLLEISKGGKAPITLPNGETRSFLEDGDEVTMTAFCVAEGAIRIGFGSVSGRVLPAI